MLKAFPPRETHRDELELKPKMTQHILRIPYKYITILVHVVFTEQQYQ